MPTLCSSRQPSIAVITALYCEKQAVDAMMDNQETYVRYTTVGKYFTSLLTLYDRFPKTKRSYLLHFDVKHITIERQHMW